MSCKPNNNNNNVYICRACYGLGTVPTAFIELILIFTVILGKVCYYFSHYTDETDRRLSTGMSTHHLEFYNNSILPHFIPISSLNRVNPSPSQLFVMQRTLIFFNLFKSELVMTLATNWFECLPHVTLHQTFWEIKRFRWKPQKTFHPASVAFYLNLSNGMLLMNWILPLRVWFCFALYCCVDPKGGNTSQYPSPPSRLQTVPHFIWLGCWLLARIDGCMAFRGQKFYTLAAQSVAHRPAASVSAPSGSLLGPAPDLLNYICI